MYCTSEQPCEAHQGRRCAGHHDGQLIPHLTPHQHVHHLAPVLHRARGLRVADDVGKLRHGHHDGRGVGAVDLASVDERVVVLPAEAGRDFDRGLLGRHLLNAGADVLVEVLVVACAKRRHDVLAGQLLDRVVLGSQCPLWQQHLTHLAIAHHAEMHLVYAVVIQNIHGEDVMCTQKYLFCDVVAVLTYLAALHEHAAVLAVRIPIGRLRAHDLHGWLIW